MKLYNAVQHVANVYEEDGQQVDGNEIWQHMELEPEFSAYEFQKKMTEALNSASIFNVGEFIKQVFQEAGFDGIKQDAYHEFGKGPHQKHRGGMDIPQGTHHYVVFEPKHIKSAIGNSGKFSPTNPKIIGKNEQPNQSEETFA
jgi:hypothetical protein